MKIKELIAKLSLMDQEANVAFMSHASDDSYFALPPTQTVTNALWFSPGQFEGDTAGTVVMWGPVVDKHNERVLQGVAPNPRHKYGFKYYGLYWEDSSNQNPPEDVGDAKFLYYLLDHIDNWADISLVKVSENTWEDKANHLTVTYLGQKQGE